MKEGDRCEHLDFSEASYRYKVWHVMYCIQEQLKA